MTQMFEFDQDIIKSNIQAEVYEDWSKTVASGCTQDFNEIWPSDLVF